MQPRTDVTLARRRHGAVLIYTMIAMTALVAMCSLAVDYGHVQEVKTELQRCADATARSTLTIYSVYGSSTAQAYAPQIATVNPVDSGSSISPDIAITWGWWDAAANVFHAGSGSPLAVQVVAARTAAHGNAVPLSWGAIIGMRTCDVSCTSVAMLVSNASQSVAVPATSDPWLAGMPSGSIASYDDAAPGQSPYKVTSIPVVPGSYITLTNVSGTVQHASDASATGPEGSTMYSHGIDSPGGPTPAAENGIADVVMPINAFLGVFLDNNAPNTTPAPNKRDYSSASSRDQTTYDDIQIKQPFYMGDGKTSSGTVQQFRVPPGATRLYLGVMDGYEWKNNTGSFSATLSVIQSVSMVK